MRKDIETREIADADLDNVAGGATGLSVQGGAGPVAGGAQIGVDGLGLNGLGLDTVTSALPQVGGVTDTVSGVTGLAGL